VNRFDTGTNVTLVPGATSKAAIFSALINLYMAEFIRPGAICINRGELERSC